MPLHVIITAANTVSRERFRPFAAGDHQRDDQPDLDDGDSHCQDQ